MDRTLRILLIPGSLRGRSTNVAVLRTARSLAPAGSTGLLFEGLADLPPFNPDEDAEPLPYAVADLRGQIRDRNVSLFSAPEYAGGLPGSFKNLLDWTVGDEQVGSIYEKPVAWINASPRGAPNAARITAEGTGLCEGRHRGIGLRSHPRHGSTDHR